jgi:hypothetical protein
MWFFPLQQFAVATCWSGGSVFPLWIFLLQVAAAAPQTTWWLLAIFPNVPELLAVVALLESAVLSSLSVRLLISKPVACLKWATFLENFGCVAVASFLGVP